MNRTERIEALIGNEECPWGEDHRDFLLNLEDGEFDNIEAPYVQNEDPDESKSRSSQSAGSSSEPSTPAQAANDDEEDEEDEEPATNADDFIQSCKDPALRESLSHGMRILSEQKAELVKLLTANKRCSYSKEELQGMKLEDLEKLATLAGVEEADYSGQQPEVVGNDSGVAPAMPEIDWTK